MTQVLILFLIFLSQIFSLLSLTIGSVWPGVVAVLLASAAVALAFRGFLLERRKK